MNPRPTVIITGSSGFVGSALVSYFFKLGFQVRAFQRRLPKQSDPPAAYYSFDLAEVKDQGFAGADYLIHCAYQSIISRQEKKSDMNTDIEGTKKVISLSRKYAIKIVFLSTISAHPKAESYYARNKLLAEGLFDTKKDLILKLGLVLGDGGGLFGKIISSLTNNKIVPLVGGGRQHIQTIALDDLCRIIEIGINKNIVGNFTIAHPSIITMNELYRKIARCIGVKPLFIPVPLIVTYRLSQLMEMMGFKLPFTSENVLGLKDLKTFNTNPDLEVFGLKVKDYKTTLNQLSFLSNANQ
ncbi:MAG: NAD-dependent epimerase/dehydratase [Parcubacteria group bacterium Gr01-1014_2]|nr:MAG: NAD-dependent epimerase/dehydratase [Parcubacteria group bacterium Gr01-1014_2]